MAEKLFYSMGEVSEMFDVNPSLIRHWESQFSIIRPKRNKKGNRLFTPEDVANMKLIYHLVKEQGMTLEGAKKALRQRRGDSRVVHDMELLERLQRVRSMLEEVREELKGDGSEMLVSDDTAAGGAGTHDGAISAAPQRRAKAVVQIPDAADASAVSTADAEQRTGETKIRRPRRKKGEEEEKELFAFYEQSLF